MTTPAQVYNLVQAVKNLRTALAPFQPAIGECLVTVTLEQPHYYQLKADLVNTNPPDCLLSYTADLAVSQYMVIDSVIIEADQG